MNEETQDRKPDIRTKIILSGLFVRAELDNLYKNYPDIFYGMLLYNKPLMQDQPKIINTWQELGKKLLD